MIVLSLFDGISCGRVALERAGIKVDKYYASEIDKYSIQVTMSHYPDTIQLGDITNWEKWNIEPPDIIMGGSPCQGFSRAGKQLNFSDPRSKLFFIFADILKHYHPKYFLLENVVMIDEYKNIISKILGEIYPEEVKQRDIFGIGKINPIMINSALLSAQNRERLYWCNWEVDQPKDKRILLKDIIENPVLIKNQLIKKIKGGKGVCNEVGIVNDIKYEKDQRVYSIEGKSPTITCTNGAIPKIALDKGILQKIELIPESFFECFNSTIYIYFKDENNITWRTLTVIEWCRLQTLPDNYCGCIPKNKAYSALGNGWTVDVIVHILKSINKVLK